MQLGQRGITAVFTQIPSNLSDTQLRRLVVSLGLPALDMHGPKRLRQASKHWNLVQMGLISELAPIFLELSHLPSFDYLLSLARDLSFNPPGQVWLPDHPARVAEIARLIATDGLSRIIRRQRFRWSLLPSQACLEGLQIGALFHDVGKLFCPQVNLAAQPPPIDAVLKTYQAHPALGYRALQPIAWPWPEVLTVVLHHHELLDGKGFPEKLDPNDTPWAAQIVGIADYCDNLLRPQRYRREFSADQLADLIRTQGPTLYCEPLVQALLEVWDKVISAFDLENQTS